MFLLLGIVHCCQKATDMTAKWLYLVFSVFGVCCLTLAGPNVRELAYRPGRPGERIKRSHITRLLAISGFKRLAATVWKQVNTRDRKRVLKGAELSNVRDGINYYVKSGGRLRYYDDYWKITGLKSEKVPDDTIQSLRLSSKNKRGETVTDIVLYVP